MHIIFIKHFCLSDLEVFNKYKLDIIDSYNKFDTIDMRLDTSWRDALPTLGRATQFVNVLFCKF